MQTYTKTVNYQGRELEVVFEHEKAEPQSFDCEGSPAHYAIESVKLLNPSDIEDLISAKAVEDLLELVMMPE